MTSTELEDRLARTDQYLEVLHAAVNAVTALRDMEADRDRYYRERKALQQSYLDALAERDELALRRDDTVMMERLRNLTAERDRLVDFLYRGLYMLENSVGEAIPEWIGAVDAALTQREGGADE